MSEAPQAPYDAVLLVSFGGPEKTEDVMPFLENVTRGRGVPAERLREVAEHYHHFGGRSPINDLNRALVRALEGELKEHGPALPVYWGNRNWHPLLPDTLRQMRDDGRRRALAFVTSAFGTYSGCRQYREDIERARVEVGQDAPEIEKLRLYYDHPGFIEPFIESVNEALGSLPESERAAAHLVFTAHSIPLAMAATSPYVTQLREMSSFIGERVARPFTLAYQSRSGSPTVPWLEPDVLDHVRELASTGVTAVVLVPIGFVSDHMEVVWDLDEEALPLARELGLHAARARTPGSHPRFVRMIRELLLERIDGAPVMSVGTSPRAVTCGPTCCAWTRSTRSG